MIAGSTELAVLNIEFERSHDSKINLLSADLEAFLSLPLKANERCFRGAEDNDESLCRPIQSQYVG